MVISEWIRSSKRRTVTGLGSWVSHCRRDYKKGMLAEERIEALEALGFIWDPFEQRFQEGFTSLTTYKAEHGHVRVHTKFETKDGYRLGSWVSHCRRDYKKGMLAEELGLKHSRHSDSSGIRSNNVSRKDSPL